MCDVNVAHIAIKIATTAICMHAPFASKLPLERAGHPRGHGSGPQAFCDLDRSFDQITICVPHHICEDLEARSDIGRGATASAAHHGALASFAVAVSHRRCERCRENPHGAGFSQGVRTLGLSPVRCAPRLRVLQLVVGQPPLPPQGGNDPAMSSVCATRRASLGRASVEGWPCGGTRAVEAESYSDPTALRATNPGGSPINSVNLAGNVGAS